MRNIFSILGKSPFGPLNRHTEQVHEAVEGIRPLMEAFMAGDHARTVEMSKRISSLEHEADLTKEEIRSHLPKSLYLPVDRGDLLSFLKEQDNIADRAEDLGELVSLRETPTVPEMREPVLAFVDQVIRTSESGYDASRELTVLQEASFRGAEANKVLELVRRVGHEEWQADKLERKALKALFAHENELDPVSVTVWINILAALDRIADHAENTADILRLLMARA